MKFKNNTFNDIVLRKEGIMKMLNKILRSITVVAFCINLLSPISIKAFYENEFEIIEINDNNYVYRYKNYIYKFEKNIVYMYNLNYELLDVNEIILSFNFVSAQAANDQYKSKFEDFSNYTYAGTAQANVQKYVQIGIDAVIGYLSGGLLKGIKYGAEIGAASGLIYDIANEIIHEGDEWISYDHYISTHTKCSIYISNLIDYYGEDGRYIETAWSEPGFMSDPQSFTSPASCRYL